ncbi:2-amino-4-hydroxy-6-hydroxymethyldihydropteridine diphosphokinase [Ascidiimonas sp. W6]|uniref:2-amino-4-hydroxy-6- hydroxymethyldihydropteridine diphosphokinase n=1 Tax=Ascidiimonas meishanensis TaxID=3128903 RepID=UPI0030EC62A3
MKNLRRAYISLGSNQGDKWHYLREAAFLIDKDAGLVKTTSAVYESTAWGFEGDDFLNACIGIDTMYSPEILLRILFKIERQLGRIRDHSKEYRSRTIDIDLLFYDNHIQESASLVLPHPHIEKRRFVLAPLADIAPGKVHPLLKKSITQLLNECKDESLLKKTDYKFYLHKNDFSRLNFMAIEGNIGAGKTTLAKKIAEDFSGKLILERFADNPFLPKFYEDKNRYAFPLEMSFLADRYQQFTDDTSQPDLFTDFMVSDYDVYKSLIFANVTLQEEEFRLYRKLFHLMYKDVVKPDLYVYLYQNTGRLLENIKKRGRDYEQSIPPDYLDRINHGYFEYMKTQDDLRILVIDISDKDFVKNSGDYEEIIDTIHTFIN